MKKLFLVLFAILIIYFLKTNFAQYNLEKSISACILGQKQKSQSFNLEEAQKFCEKKLGK
tara:strand:+ start:294 stop:473 length:180 start_codon:yes stop_codon:yes gene_type:complete